MLDAKHISSDTRSMNKLPLEKRVHIYCYALALYFVWCNFLRNHKIRVTPAMAAGVTDRLWELEDFVGLTD